MFIRHCQDPEVCETVTRAPTCLASARRPRWRFAMRFVGCQIIIILESLVSLTKLLVRCYDDTRITSQVIVTDLFEASSGSPRRLKWNSGTEGHALFARGHCMDHLEGTLSTTTAKYSQKLCAQVSLPRSKVRGACTLPRPPQARNLSWRRVRPLMRKGSICLLLSVRS
jgi:hypothetical protein